MDSHLHTEKFALPMSIQKLSLESVQKIRQYISTGLKLPDPENQPKTWFAVQADEEIPEPESLADLGGLFNIGSLVEETNQMPNTQGRWFISSTNPGDVLIKLPGLRLKPEIRWVSYLYRLDGNGVGMVWAIPEAASATAELEQALVNSGDHQHPPKPNQALTNIMDAVEGDRTPTSFVIASLLLRELKEFGAVGKYCDWSHHRLIQAIPTQVKWQWRIEAPKDFSPKVKVLPDGRAAVEFFTCRVTPPIAIFQHIDQYPTEQYHPQSLDRAIAIPQRAS
jgi:hypothetical protein